VDKSVAAVPAKAGRHQHGFVVADTRSHRFHRFTALRALLFHGAFTFRSTRNLNNTVFFMVSMCQETQQTFSSRERGLKPSA
jgi:hypothetical protein